MSDKALGLIETKGLIGAIEAADAAAKAAAVIVSSAELTEAAFMTIRIEGDLGAVQAAVEIGARAAEKIGELVSVHIIANPDDGLSVVVPPLRYISKYHPDDKRPALEMKDAEDGLPVKVRTAPIKKKTQETGLKEKKRDGGDMDKMTVSELRQIARSIENFPLKGREISMANKNQLIDAIKKFKDEDK